LRNIVRVG